MAEAFTTKERKKAFDQLFKEKVLPFFKTYGFARHTKTSKRLFKNFKNGLSVFLFFEYKSFGYGFYDITMSYFDEEMGNVYDDNYLVMGKLKTPTLEVVDANVLNISTDKWLLDIEYVIIPFIEKHTTHKSILESDGFYISKAREVMVFELLKRKSKIK